MKRLICILLVFLLVTACGCSNNSPTQFTPKDFGVVVYPDQETADTVNGYLKEKEEDKAEIQNIGQPLYDGNIYEFDYYVANINSKKFHYPDCRYAKKMDATSIRIEKSYDVLINEGYVPCKVCKP